MVVVLLIIIVKNYFNELHNGYVLSKSYFFDFVFVGMVTLCVQVLYWRLERTLIVSTGGE